MVSIRFIFKRAVELSVNFFDPPGKMIYKKRVFFEGITIIMGRFLWIAETC